MEEEFGFESIRSGTVRGEGEEEKKKQCAIIRDSQCADAPQLYVQ